MDAHQLEALLEETSWLRSLARSLVRDDALADDAVQETYLAALRSPPDTNRPLRPWLSRVLRNVLHQFNRGDTRRDRRERLTASAEELAAADQVLERTEMQENLMASVLRLPEAYRRAIIMSHFEELSTAEIAAALKVPESTVRSRLQRGREQLRELLDQKYGDRATWCAMVLPLIESPAPPWGTVLAASGASKVMKLCVAALVIVGGSYLAVRLSAPSDVPDEIDVAVSGTSPSAAAPAIVGPNVELERDEVRNEVRSSDPASGAMREIVFRVTSEAGDPIPSAEVELVVRNLAKGMVVHAQGIADESGRVRLEPNELSEEERRDKWRYYSLVAEVIEVRAKGYAPLLEFQAGLRKQDLESPSLGAIDLGVMELERGTRVSGSVTDQDGRPLTVIALYLGTEWPHLPELPSNLCWRVVGDTSTQGDFMLEDPVASRGLRNGRQFVLVAVTDVGLAAVRLDTPKGKREHSAELVVETMSFTVRVQDAADGPVAHADVILKPRRGTLGSSPISSCLDNALFDDLQLSLRARTNEFGVVEFERLPVRDGEGRYEIEVQHASFAHYRAEHPVSTESEREAAIPLRGIPRIIVAGIVRDEVGRPVAGAIVRAGRDGEATTTDEKGSYVLPTVRVEGTFFLTVEAEGFGFFQEPLDPTPGKERHVTLAEAAPVVLDVRDELGRPVEDIYAPQLVRGNLNLIGEPSAETPGRYAFPKASAGPWRVSFFGRVDEPWDLPEDEWVEGGTEKAIVLARAADQLCTLRVTLVDPTGTSLLVTSARVDRLQGDLAHASVEYGDVVIPKFRRGASRVLWIELADRPFTFCTVEAPRDLAEVDIELEIGAGATILARLEGLPYDAEAGRFTIVPIGVRIPQGQTWISNPIRSDVSDDPSRGRFDALPPASYELTWESETYRASKTILVESDGVIDVALRPERR